MGTQFSSFTLFRRTVKAVRDFFRWVPDGVNKKGRPCGVGPSEEGDDV